MPFFNELLLKKSELQDYYIAKRASEYIKGAHVRRYKCCRIFHPILLKLIKLNRIWIDRQKVSVLADERSHTTKPVIFAVTHIGKYDYQIVTEILKDYQVPFSGDPEKMYRTFEGFILWLNGVIYCDTEHKEDRKVAYHTMVDVLKAGYNVLIYPEGVWNISPNKLILPLFPGVIRCADESGCEIIPVGIIQRKKSFYVKIGKNIHIDSSSVAATLKEEYINEERLKLRDVMASLQYDIISSLGVYKRDEIGDYESAKDAYVKEKLHEWRNKRTKEPYYSEELISTRVYRKG